MAVTGAKGLIHDYIKDQVKYKNTGTMIMVPVFIFNYFRNLDLIFQLSSIKDNPCVILIP